MVLLPPKPGTGLRLHELYHAKYSPRVISKGKRDFYTFTPDECAREELEAVEFERGKRGKRLQWGNLRSILNTMVQMWTPSVSFNALVRTMESVGYTLDREQRSYLWDYAKEKAKELKGKD